MAIFGYIIYMIITLWASIICLGVFSWPGHDRGERIASVVIFGLFWLGAYNWAPFSVSLS